MMEILIGIVVLLIGVYFLREIGTWLGWVVVGVIKVAAWLVRKLRNLD